MLIQKNLFKLWRIQAKLYIIGLYDGHNSNAALIKNGKIIKAIEEEKYSKIKNHNNVNKKCLSTCIIP